MARSPRDLHRLAEEPAALTPKERARVIEGARSKDPRPTLTAYGAPLFYVAKRDMPLEEAIVRSLQVFLEDPTVLLSLPLVLVRNEGVLDVNALLAKARELDLQAELGMLLDLTGQLAKRRRFRTLARRLKPSHTRLRYLTDARSSYARRAADECTPPAAARWGFRMNMPESSFRQFLLKHHG